MDANEVIEEFYKLVIVCLLIIATQRLVIHIKAHNRFVWMTTSIVGVDLFMPNLCSS